MITNPINAFPEKLQEILAHYSETRGYPVEFFITGVLSACSTAIGRSVTLNTGNFKSIAIIWAAIVAKPGINKSASLEDAFEPVNEYQDRIWRQWFIDKQDFEEMKRNNPKDKTELYNPQLCILSDITPEALSISLSNNPKGCAIVYDELAGFVGRFNRYNSGADEQMFLSLFNGGGINRVRMKSETNAYIKNSFLTIVGTIQPAIIKQVFSGKSDSGFFDRWLLCFPDNIVKQYPNSIGLDNIIRSSYHNIVSRLLQLSYNPDAIVEAGYTESSYKIVNDYQKSIIDIQNSSDNDSERALLSKMEVYLHRFALIIKMIELACNDDVNWITEDWKDISDSAAKGAVILTEYYITQAKQLRLQSPVESLKDQWKDIYEALPGPGIAFDRAKFINICAKFDIKTRRADVFLKDNSERSESKLFNKVSHGTFTKNLF